MQYERPLRVAVETLRRAGEDVTATTVVGIVGADDLEALEDLVRSIADECGLESHIRLRGDSFAVRFSRHAASIESSNPALNLKALVLGLLRG